MTNQHVPRQLVPTLTNSFSKPINSAPSQLVPKSTLMFLLLASHDDIDGDAMAMAYYIQNNLKFKNISFNNYSI